MFRKINEDEEEKVYFLVEYSDGYTGRYWYDTQADPAEIERQLFNDAYHNGIVVAMKNHPFTKMSEGIVLGATYCLGSKRQEVIIEVNT